MFSCATVSPGQQTVPASTSSEIEANGFNFDPDISDGGRFVVFESEATNLVVGDTDGFPDVYLRDRTGGTTERASVGGSGNKGNCSSTEPAVNGDGRFVSFSSCASNLVDDDMNLATDIFVRHRTVSPTATATPTPAGPAAARTDGGSALPRSAGRLPVALPGGLSFPLVTERTSLSPLPSPNHNRAALSFG